MTRRQERAFVALKLPTRVPELVTTCQAILDACARHPLLTHPTPSLAQLASLLKALVDAQTDLGLGGRGKRSARDHALTALRRGMTTLARCVEDQANLDLEHAHAFIAAAFMSPRADSTRRKQPFSVKEGRVSGSAILDVLAAGDNAAYQWQCSFDGGATWVVKASTKQSKVTLRGLPVGSYVHLRCQYSRRDNVPRLTETIVFLVK